MAWRFPMFEPLRAAIRRAEGAVPGGQWQ